MRNLRINQFELPVVSIVLNFYQNHEDTSRPVIKPTGQGQNRRTTLRNDCDVETKKPSRPTGFEDFIVSAGTPLCRCLALLTGHWIYVNRQKDKGRLRVRISDGVFADSTNPGMP